MLCLKSSGLDIIPDGPVLKRDQYAEVLEAGRLIALAEEEARMIREKALQEAEEMRQAGYAKGLEEGREEIAEHIVATMGQSAAYFSKVENVLVDVVMRALRRMLGEFDRSELVENVVKQALQTLRNEGHVVVRVPPEQAEGLRGRLDSLLASSPRVQFLQVLPDPRLPDDGCVLETEIGVVDASLETQLRAIEKALIQSMK